MSKLQIACGPIQALVAAAIMFSSAAFAAEVPPAADPVPSKEVREKMAAAHEAMAACLRSDRSVADCRNDMQTTCKKMHGDGCMMMSMALHERMQK